MSYTKQTWADTPNTSSPINASRLNHMEDGIEAANQLATTSTDGQMSSEDKTKLDSLNKPEIQGKALIFS